MTTNDIHVLKQIQWVFKGLSKQIAFVKKSMTFEFHKYQTSIFFSMVIEKPFVCISEF